MQGDEFDLFWAIRIVGTFVPRLEGRDKVTGQARYVDDMILPSMLHGATVRSRIPLGKDNKKKHLRPRNPLPRICHRFPRKTSPAKIVLPSSKATSPALRRDRDEFPLHLSLEHAICIHHVGRVRCKPGPRIAATLPRRLPSRKLIKHKLEEP